MTISQPLAIAGVICLVIATVFARRHLLADRGLRHGLGGLLVSASAGVGITFSPRPQGFWLLAAVMLAGVALMTWNLPRGQKRKQ
jgi:hypothetical protein